MVVCAMKVSRHFTSICMLTLVTVNAILPGYVSNGDRTLEAALPQNNSINRLQNAISNQSDDIKSIRNSTAAEVQVLKNIAQGFQITSSQIMFTTLTVFLLGVTLIIYGLRLTLRAPRQTSRYFKAMMCALISPVIVIITAYQLGIAFQAPLEIYKIAPTLLIISLLLWIPTGVIIFLLVADNKLMRHLEHRE
jgi:hypothetical protein